MNPEEQNQFFVRTFGKIKKIAGIDHIYALNKERTLIKEEKISGNDNHLSEIANILKSESAIEKLATTSYSKTFHMYTFLNENGLTVILKLKSSDTFYIVVIAGENEPVDLINLLKTCKETRLDFENHLEASI